MFKLLAINKSYAVEENISGDWIERWTGFPSFKKAWAFAKRMERKPEGYGRLRVVRVLREPVEPTERGPRTRKKYQYLTSTMKEAIEVVRETGGLAIADGRWWKGANGALLRYKTNKMVQGQTIFALANHSILKRTYQNEIYFRDTYALQEGKENA